jgi:hypothetical protein
MGVGKLKIGTCLFSNCTMTVLAMMLHASGLGKDRDFVPAMTLRNQGVPSLWMGWM